MWTVSSPHWPTILLAVLLVFFHLRVTIFRIPVARYPNLVANRMNVGKLAVATFLSGFRISFPETLLQGHHRCTLGFAAPKTTAIGLGNTNKPELVHPQAMQD